jgi:hypothetical protein
MRRYAFIAACSRRQLVYAWGESIALPALDQRMEVVQALMLMLSDLFDKQSPLLTADGVVLKTKDAAQR